MNQTSLKPLNSQFHKVRFVKVILNTRNFNVTPEIEPKLTLLLFFLPVKLTCSPALGPMQN